MVDQFQTKDSRRYRRVLLVRLAYVGYLGNVDIFPVGLGYLSESLEREGICFDVLDLALAHPSQERKLLLQKVQAYQPDLLAITMMTLGYQTHYALLDEVKRLFPHVDMVMGGPHLSTVRDGVLRECQGLDYGVVMEGERPLLELCQGVELAQIRGLIYRDGGDIVFTGEQPYADLDRIPFPRYQKHPITSYAPDIPIVTSRGCPYSCTFCPVSTAIGKKFRARSPENVVEEMRYWYQRGYRRFSIWDDNFTLLKSRAWEICDLIGKQGWRDIGISVPNGIRADRVDRDLLMKMKEVGFYQLSFGVESGVNRVLKAVKKGETVETIEKSIAEACELGYEVYLYFIIGLPGEHWEDFEASLAFAQKYPVAESRFYNLVPFPGTEIFNWAAENRYFLSPSSEFLNRASHFLSEPSIATPEMSAEERKKAFQMAWEVTKRQRVAWRARQLKRFGPVGKVLAAISASDAYHELFKPVWFRKWVTEPFKKLVGLYRFPGNPRVNY